MNCLLKAWIQSKNCKLHESICERALCSQNKLGFTSEDNNNNDMHSVNSFNNINNINNITKLKQYWSNQKKRFIANLFAIITKPFALKSFCLNICNGQMPCTASRNSWELCFDSMTTTFMHMTSVTCWKWRPASKLQITRFYSICHLTLSSFTVYKGALI